MTKKGTSSEDEAQVEDSKETQQPSEVKDEKKETAEDTAKTNKSEDSKEKAEEESKAESKAESKGNTELSEAEKVRRNADSQISKMSSEVQKREKVLENQIKKNPKILLDLYDEDQELALRIAERNPDLAEKALATEEDLEDLTDEQKFDRMYENRKKKETFDSMQNKKKDDQIKIITEFLKANPQITQGSDLENRIFTRFKTYTREDATPEQIKIILEDSLKLATDSSYEAGADAATLAGVANAVASESVGGKGSSPKSKVKLTQVQKDFCDKHNMDYEEYAKFI